MSEEEFEKYDIAYDVYREFRAENNSHLIPDYLKWLLEKFDAREASLIKENAKLRKQLERL